MVPQEKKKDTMTRPDHYKCISCSARFNDAKFIQQESNGIYSAQASCPECGSTKIKISWWKKKSKR